MLGIIPRPVHAALDYIYGATALLLPKALDFEDSQNGKMVATVLGAKAILMGLATKHEGGVVKLIPFNTHLKMDAAVAVLGLAAPWLLGFASHKKARNTIVGLGALAAVVTLLSKPDEE